MSIVRAGACIRGSAGSAARHAWQCVFLLAGLVEAADGVAEDAVVELDGLLHIRRVNDGVAEPGFRATGGHGSLLASS